MATAQRTIAQEIPCFIFIGGFGSGKSYYAEHMRELIEKEYGVKVHRVSMATKIKEVATDVFGMKEKDRRLLQQLGTKLRELNQDVWINYLIRDIMRNEKIPFMMDDIRLPREAEVFRNTFPNVVIVRLNTPDEKRMETYQKVYGRKPTHAELYDVTETEIANIEADITLNNNYNPPDAEQQIRELMVKGRLAGAAALRRV